MNARLHSAPAGLLRIAIVTVLAVTLGPALADLPGGLPAAGQIPGHEFVIPQFQSPARLGTDLTQSPWNTAARVTGFLKLHTRQRAKHPTSLYACYDQSALWLAFRCEGVDGRSARTEAKKRDSRVWWDDSVEFYCSPDQSRWHYMQFVANAAGVVYDGKDTDGTWNADWDVRSSVDAQGFTICMRIPFSALKAESPKPGQAWTVNFTRHGPLSGSSTWSWCYNDLWDARQFGRLVFGGPGIKPARVAGLSPLAIGTNTFSLGDAAGQTCRIVGRDRSGALLFRAEPAPQARQFAFSIADDRVRSVETIIHHGDQTLARWWSDVRTPELTGRLAAWQQRFETFSRTASRFPAADQAEAKALFETAQPRLTEAIRIAENTAAYSEDRWRRLETLLDGFDKELADAADYACTLDHFPGAGFAIGFESPMRRVMIRDFPFEGRFDKEAGVSLAANEHEGFQVAVMPWKRDLKNARVKAAFPADSRAATAGLSCAVSLVGHVDVNDDPPYDSKYKAFWPDPLLSFLQQSDIKAGEHVAFWIDVASSKTTPAGDYRGSIEISADGFDPVSLPLAVRVWGFALPDGTHLRNAFTYHQNAIPGIYKGSWNEKLSRAYQDLILDHRLGIDHLYRGEPPDLETLQRAVGRGMNSFNVLFAGSGGMKQRVSEVLTQYVPRIRKAGLFSRAYLYGFDEIKPEKFNEVREVFNAAHQLAPGLPTMTTAQDTSFGKETGLRDAVDIWVPLTPSYDLREAEELRREGKQMWWYICLVPIHPYANWFIEYPAIESRLLMGALSHKYRVDGFLYYLVNNGWERNRKVISSGPYTQWDGASCANSQGKWANGDGNLIYPGPERPLSSIRLENIRDGLEDYEYLHLLAEGVERVSKLPATTARQAFLDRARPLLTVPDTVARSVVDYTLDPHAVEQWRAQLAALITQADGLASNSVPGETRLQRPPTAPRTSPAIPAQAPRP